MGARNSAKEHRIIIKTNTTSSGADRMATIREANSSVSAHSTQALDARAERHSPDEFAVHFHDESAPDVDFLQRVY